jgi:hypothetical protein
LRLGGVRLVETLLAQRQGSGNGTSEAWRFLKTFEDLRNPCHVMVVGPQADFVHQRFVAIMGFV